MTVTTLDPVRRAVAADHQIRALDRTIRLIAALAPSPDSGIEMCHGCLWSGIVKPLAQLLLGPDRGIVDEAEDNAHIGRFVDIAAFLNEPDRPPASTETERWLRSDEAYHALTNEWLRLLHAADPANGCGLPAHPRGSRPTSTPTSRAAL